MKRVFNLIACFLMVMVCSANSLPISKQVALFQPIKAAAGGGGGGGTVFITTAASGASNPAFSGLIGFEFVANGTTIDHLGWYVTSGNVLPHTMYILDSSGNILVTQAVTAGNTGTYGYATISNFVTSNGTSYFIMVSDGTENYTGDGSAIVSTTAGGTITESCYLLNTELGNTTPHIVDNGSKTYFGPNFQWH